MGKAEGAADWGHGATLYQVNGVHPDLGTPADLDELIAEAGARGIKVLLDLAPNHTSSAHPWFTDASSRRESTGVITRPARSG